MPNVSFGDVKEAIFNTSVYFDNTYLDSWITNPFGKKIIPSEYDIKDAHDIQEALKDLLGSTIKEMMEAEMEAHLGLFMKIMIDL